jgi:hypothetical protein
MTQVQVQPLLPEGRRVYPREWFAPGVTLDLSDAPQAVPVLVLANIDSDPDTLLSNMPRASRSSPSSLWATASSGIWRLASISRI